MTADSSIPFKTRGSLNCAGHQDPAVFAEAPSPGFLIWRYKQFSASMEKVSALPAGPPSASLAVHPDRLLRARS